MKGNEVGGKKLFFMRLARTLTNFFVIAVVVKVQSSGTVDRVKTRLERLDEYEEGSVRQLLDLSQQEYTARIEQLNSELVQAWRSDFRVKALKIAIQVRKRY